ncbi:DNA-(apurinic or apyrimidinic site) endonuclease 2-like [Ruditapes philippinarum]|uniref:DNA-(apurinic or apyrimidinic site) endonuclease 2-like n=1 Tax=Ruditapes philippinarum TaxID=129788 RepID=UPI00295B30B9|nr:DNA-(apurinic or apyrimidinic site) endonuclease 2-like [Ruditapes philippinarum]
MKILSWNINGIRASKIDLKNLFDSLNADVICLQETKVTRDMLDEPTAIVDGYNSYYSFSRKRSGYSGRAMSQILKELHKMEMCGTMGNHLPFKKDELQDLDAEGRAIITQHRIRFEDGCEKDLAIINVYCPRFDPERHDRHHYKLRFYALLQTRAEALLKSGSCEATDEESQNNKRPSRIWFNQMFWERGRDPSLETELNQDEFSAVTPHTVGGKFVDTYRYFHPEKENAFTNWCTLTNARATNYGRRLDYILADIELATKCLTDASILQDVEGSDHCPITINLNCTCLPPKTCPPLCTKFMPEFSGKQQKLSTFFMKLTKKVTSDTPDVSENIKETDEVEVVKEEIKSCSKSVSSLKRPEKFNNVPQPLKKQKTAEMKKSNSSSKQASLMSFFNNKGADKKSAVKLSQDVKVEHIKSADKIKTIETSSKYFNNTDKSTEKANDAEDKSMKTSVINENSSKTASAWKNLLGGLGPAPLCKGHSEPCVLRMVKKPGPNKGKQFYTCARGEGLKSNPEARCDFFKWVVKKKT